MKQDGRVYLRIPEAEKALWEEQATLCGYKSLSDWIRVRCDVSRGEVELEGVAIPVPTPVPPATTVPLPPIAKPVVRTMAHPGNCRCMMCKIGRGEKV